MPLKNKIAFYSPVPGSGATLMSKGFADFMANTFGKPVHLVSCDFRYSVFDNQLKQTIIKEGPVTVFLPYINRNQCILCKACAKACVFGAIKIESALSYISLKADRCRACGACLNICRYGAIQEKERVIGVWRKYELHGSVTFYEGRLLAEDFFAIHLLQQVLGLLPENEFCIIDAYSGLNYPAMESLHHCQTVIVVIDPSTFDYPFFKHTLSVIKKYHHHILVVINYSGAESLEIKNLFHQDNIEVIDGFPDLGIFKEGVFENTGLSTFNQYRSIMTQLYDNISLLGQMNGL